MIDITLSMLGLFVLNPTHVLSSEDHVLMEIEMVIPTQDWAVLKLHEYPLHQGDFLEEVLHSNLEEEVEVEGEGTMLWLVPQ